MSRLRGTLMAAVSLALLFFVLPTVASAQDATLQATLSYVGPGPSETSIFRYDYTLTNNSVTPADHRADRLLRQRPGQRRRFPGGSLGLQQHLRSSAAALTAPTGGRSTSSRIRIRTPGLVDFFTPTGAQLHRRPARASPASR